MHVVLVFVLAHNILFAGGLVVLPSSEFQRNDYATVPT
jgi:hypothetical protein